MTPTQKLNKVISLVKELEDEKSLFRIECRIGAVALELGVSPFQCGIVYWAMKAAPDFKAMFGADVKVRVRPK